MKTEVKKSLVFGAVISFLTSTYAAFLKTFMIQGFSGGHFLNRWLKEIAGIYLFILPFVLLIGPVVRIIVDRIFKNEKQ